MRAQAETIQLEHCIACACGELVFVFSMGVVPVDQGTKAFISALGEAPKQEQRGSGRFCPAKPKNKTLQPTPRTPH